MVYNGKPYQWDDLGVPLFLDIPIYILGGVVATQIFFFHPDPWGNDPI